MKAKTAQKQTIHKIDRNEWIDPMDQQLNRQSLLELLKTSSGSSVVAISNIPYTKTIVERHVGDSFDVDDRADDDWLVFVRQRLMLAPPLQLLTWLHWPKKQAIESRLAALGNPLNEVG